MLSRSQQYYIDNKERIKNKSLQYYYDNQETRKKYNNDYWAEHKQKYLEERKHSIQYKNKQREYYEIHKYKPKVIKFPPENKKNKINKILSNILQNRIPPPLIMSHTLYFD